MGAAVVVERLRDEIEEVAVRRRRDAEDGQVADVADVHGCRSDQRWSALTGLEGTPAFNVGRAYAALAADIDDGTHTVPDFADAVRRHELIADIERFAASGERVTV